MSAPEISLPRFAGPLDLLLELVRKSKIAITDIPIAEITRQYLDYLHEAEALDIDLGSEFAYTAALLIHIKSRCLLKTDPEVAGPGDDPRQELVRLLLDHEELRNAAEFLRQKLEVSQATWSKSSEDDFRDPAFPEPAAPAGAFNLLQVLQLARQALDTARVFELVMPREQVSVEEMVEWLRARLAAPWGRIDAGRLLAEQPTAEHRATLFLAMLELAKDGIVSLDQQQCFGPIQIHTAQPGHNIMSAGDCLR